MIFIEVKYRKDALKGNPLEAVGYGKCRKICRVADYYRMCKRIKDDSFIRFDVVSILGESVTWIKNAFEYIPQK